MSSDSWVLRLEKQDEGMEVMVEGCDFRDGRGLGTGWGTTEAERDIGGEWSEAFLVGGMELFLKSATGLESKKNWNWS